MSCFELSPCLCTDSVLSQPKTFMSGVYVLLIVLKVEVNQISSVNVSEEREIEESLVEASLLVLFRGFFFFFLLLLLLQNKTKHTKSCFQVIQKPYFSRVGTVHLESNKTNNTLLSIYMRFWGIE